MPQARDGVCRLNSQLVSQVGARVPGTFLKWPLGFEKAASPPWLWCQHGDGWTKGDGDREGDVGQGHEGMEKRNVLLEVQGREMGTGGHGRDI